MPTSRLKPGPVVSSWSAICAVMIPSSCRRLSCLTTNTRNPAALFAGARVWATAQSPSVTQSPPRRTTRAQLALRLPISLDPGTGRPMRVAWALEELRLDYETVAVSPEQCGAGEHLARHPLGRVPALELADGQILFESTAIVLAIADMHPRTDSSARRAQRSAARSMSGRSSG
jgi:hypothetical protein